MRFKDFLNEGVYDPNIFKAIFLAGGPGSGKSYVSTKVTGGHGLKMINSDIAFEKMLKDAHMEMSPENIFSPKGQEIRDKAKKLTNTKQQNYIRGRLGLVIDGTGKDFNSIKKKSDALKEIGYDTIMIFVNTSLEVAQQRNMKRERSLDPKEVENMWNAVQQNIGKFQHYFGNKNFIIVDNNDAGEDIFNEVWKRVMVEVRRKPENHIAIEWIKNELEARKK